MNQDETHNITPVNQPSEGLSNYNLFFAWAVHEIGILKTEVKELRSKYEKPSDN